MGGERRLVIGSEMVVLSASSLDDRLDRKRCVQHVRVQHALYSLDSLVRGRATMDFEGIPLLRVSSFVR